MSDHRSPLKPLIICAAIATTFTIHPGPAVAQGQIAEADHRPGSVVRNQLGMEFAFIPAGSFVMGLSDSELQAVLAEATSRFGSVKNPSLYSAPSPAHRVTISRPFYLGKYEVTQERWEAVMGSNPSAFKGTASAGSALTIFLCRLAPIFMRR